MCIKRSGVAVFVTPSTMIVRRDVLDGAQTNRTLHAYHEHYRREAIRWHWFIQRSDNRMADGATDTKPPSNDLLVTNIQGRRRLGGYGRLMMPSSRCRHAGLVW